MSTASRRRCAAIALLAGSAALLQAQPAEARRHHRRAAATQAAHEDSVLALRRVGAGETWLVRQTTHVRKLVLAEGGRIEAAPGRQVVLSVDGVARPLEAGTWSGDVALSVPLELRLREVPAGAGRLLAGLCVGNGLYLPEKSVSSVLAGGRVGNGQAQGTTIASSEPGLTGVVASGGGSYALQGVRVAVAGVGVLVAGPTQLTLDAQSAVESGRAAVRLAGQGGRVQLEGAALHPGGALAEFVAGSQAQLVLRAGTYEGDIATDGAAAAAPLVTLEGATLTGAMLPAVAPGAVDDGSAWALAPSVSIGAGSRWVVTRSSRLSALVLAQAGALEARAGSSLALFVDGNPVPLVPGRYAGRVDLQVSATATP